jgi:hypothetical protein
MFDLTTAIFAGTLASAIQVHDMSNPQLDQWYAGLRVPGTTAGCCGGYDCRPTDWRVVNGHYEALIDAAHGFPNPPSDAWVEVPTEAILNQTPNPTGGAVACWNWRLICFVRPTDT